MPPLLPVEAAGPTEVDPAAAGPVPVLPVEAAWGLLGLRAGGWAGAGGLGAGAGGWGRCWGGGPGMGWELGAGGLGPGGRGGGWGWGCGMGAGAGGGRGTGGQNFSAARHIRVFTKHVHVLQLLHELFHLLLAVRAEATCAIASASSRSSWANRSRSCSGRTGARLKLVMLVSKW